MATLGKSASDCGDALYIDTVQPAWPRSKPRLEAEGDDGDLFLVQLGYRVFGEAASGTDDVAGLSATAAETGVAGLAASSTASVVGEAATGAESVIGATAATEV